MLVSPWYLSSDHATVGNTLAQLASQDCVAGRGDVPAGPGTVQGIAPFGADASSSRYSQLWSANPRAGHAQTVMDFNAYSFPKAAVSMRLQNPPMS
jgi:hypothetical protein